MQIPISLLQKPPRDSRLLREPDPTFIRSLKDNMLRDPAGPGVAPMAVLCRDVSKPTEF